MNFDEGETTMTTATERTALVLGGTGFVGSHLLDRLVTEGWRVVVPTRRLQNARDLKLLPTVEIVEADVHDPKTLERLCAGKCLVVNLVGTLHSRPGTPYGPEFARVHVELPQKLAEACQAQDVHRLIHLSALGAAPDAPSQYLRSKADGEARIRAAGDGLDWTLLRPSAIFGPGDSFLNRFAALARLFPILPIGAAQARLQPVYVGDVVEVILRAAATAKAAGQTYELAGPTVYTLAEIVAYAARTSGHPRRVVALPPRLARMQAWLLEHLLPNPPLTRDMLDSLSIDSVAHGEPLPFGLEPTPMEAIAPAYLANDTFRSRYVLWRMRARHG